MRLIGGSAIAALAVMAVVMAAPAQAGNEDRMAQARRIAELGIKIPDWFVSESAPRVAGDRGPTLSPNDIDHPSSALLVINIAASGKPAACEVVVTNGSQGLADAMCTNILNERAFEPAQAAEERAFWCHVHSGRDVSLELIEVPIIR